jgi:hypothetical protein
MKNDLLKLNRETATENEPARAAATSRNANPVGANGEHIGESQAAPSGGTAKVAPRS